MDGSLRVNFTQDCPKTAGHGVKRKRRKGKRYGKETIKKKRKDVRCLFLFWACSGLDLKSDGSILKTKNCKVKLDEINC